METCISGHVLLMLTERWEKALNNSFLVEALLLELTKTFDYILLDLLIGRHYEYGSRKKQSLTFIHIKTTVKKM